MDAAEGDDTTEAGTSGEASPGLGAFGVRPAGGTSPADGDQADAAYEASAHEASGSTGDWRAGVVAFVALALVLGIAALAVANLVPGPKRVGPTGTAYQTNGGPASSAASGPASPTTGPSTTGGPGPSTAPGTTDGPQPASPPSGQNGGGAGTRGGGDTSSPTRPANVRRESRGANSLTLAWNPSTDTGTGVAHYRIVRDATKVAEIGTATTYTATGLASTTEYVFYVLAVDGAGNVSPPSSSIMLRTGPASGGVTISLPGQVSFGTSFTVSGGNIDDETANSQVDLFIDGLWVAATSLQHGGKYQMRVQVAADGTVSTCGWCDPPFTLTRGTHSVHIVDINCECADADADGTFEVV